MSKRIVQISLVGIASIVLLACLLAVPQDTLAQLAEETPAPEKPDISINHEGFAATVGQTDNFGYELSTQTPAWKNATDGTLVSFPGRDDEYSAALNIGFTFPFYENSYTQLYVNTNGILIFGVPGDPLDSYENRNIPRDTVPDNFIAAFWDDLILVVDGTTNEPISQVFYKSGTDASGKYFVVEWNKISSVNSSSDELTFEVVLRENGDILIQYNQLVGQVDKTTVGIEDDKGVDGLLYLYNQAGLNTSTAVLFEYPEPSAHCKIYPRYQSGFSFGGKTELWFTVRNNSDKPEYPDDTYKLQLSAYDPAWEINFFNASGQALSDTNGDGEIDTGSIPRGQEIKIKIVVNSPEEAEVGEEIRVNLIAISQRDPSKTAQVSFDVAIPTPFAQAILTGGTMRLHLVWRENEISALAAPIQFTGSKLAVQRLPNGNYLYSWEQNVTPDTGYFHSDLVYTILSDVGGVQVSLKNLTNNTGVSYVTEDRFLASSVTSDGLIGTVWSRRERRNVGGVNQYRYNIFFSVINQTGDEVVPATRVTPNEQWRGESDLDIPYYLDPRITATDDNRFVIAWVTDVLKTSTKSIDDIEYAVYPNNSITPIKGPTKLTNAQLDVVSYSTPALADMASNQALLSYGVLDKVADTNALAYVVLNSSGNVVKTHTSLAGSNGATVHDSIRLNSGNVLLAWFSSTTGNVGYCLLDGSTGGVSLATQTLTPPNYRDPDSVSVARDAEGHGIITWRDSLQKEYLYYSLLDGGGAVVTYPMMFLDNLGNDSTFTTNNYGYGLASYEGSYQNLLPIILK